jgi:hypothetical protein
MLEVEHTTKAFRPPLRPTELHIQRLQRAPSPEVKRRCAEVKIARSCIVTTPVILHDVVLN